MVAVRRPAGSGGESQGATAALLLPLVGAVLRERAASHGRSPREGCALDDGPAAAPDLTVLSPGSCAD
ncbi:hypothetical protein P7K49_011138 [Saguinus oedipus]|uniref:Secreted protein n=1 Tax=Saguinus oedipus TaxID=9490 RepID=A0ABQ9VPT4_SAGOE|nr:hypothetical protein P7K49_011138 [Saguinus oedipus]